MGLRTPSGAPLMLGEPLGRGGEARVYALTGDPARAVKLYVRPDAERARKLAAMLARIPADPDRRGGHVSIAWPESLVLDDDGNVLGFVMPRIDARRYLPLHQLYHPRSRRSRAPGMSWHYLVRIARNLSGTLAALHEAGYVVGDLNESNILVDDRALVTLVDLDSIQVTSASRVFRCTVGKGEYTPPELQGRSFRDVTRRPSSDRFGLAVLTFLLLMEGNHPFTGVYGGSGEPPGMEENIRARRSPYFGGGATQPPPAAPPVTMLGPRLATLLKRSLIAPAWRRPDARTFQAALVELEADLTTCERKATHAYRRALPHCPWCQRRERLNTEAFPLAGEGGTNAAVATPGGGSGFSRGNGAAAAPVSAPVTAPVTAPASVSGRSPAARAGRVPAPAPGTPATAGPTRAPTPANRGHPSPRPPGQPASARPPGFRGSWLLFHSRLPLLSLLLVALVAAPAVLWENELRLLLAATGLSGPARLAALLSAALLPAAVVAAGLYLQARRRAGLARALLGAERLMRAALAATLLSLVASLTAGLALGRGSVLAGDWLLLPSFWVVSFAVAWRMVGPRRP